MTELKKRSKTEPRFAEIRNRQIKEEKKNEGLNRQNVKWALK